MSLDAGGSFWDHLLALRRHLLWAGLIFIVASALVFSYGSDRLITFLLQPLNGEALVFLSPLGPFLFKIRISLYAGLLVSLPIWLVFILNFVSPALSRRQRLAGLLTIFISTLLTALAIAATYLFLVPVTLKFLLGFVVPGTSFLLTADSYLAFVILQCVVAFVMLQLPLLIVLLAGIGVLNPYLLARKRHLLYPVLLILLAFLTPTTDAMTLLLVAGPTLLLAELGIAISKVAFVRK